MGVNVTFYGVRGSTPTAGEATRRYGGNTSCVAVEAPGQPPIICDLGTGLRAFGCQQPGDGTFRGTALVTHTHWDHVQGLPFFPPILAPGAELDIHGPAPDDGRGLGELFRDFMCPALFPVTVADLPGAVRFHETDGRPFRVGDAVVTALPIPHTGVTNGYRIDWDGVSMAYIPDHQQPRDGSFALTDEVARLCEDVDLLVHDAQYTRAEFERKAHWGHCCVDYALWVAHRTGARRLALFHHDPARSDDDLDEIGDCARVWGDKFGVEVLAATEGLTIAFD